MISNYKEIFVVIYDKSSPFVPFDTYTLWHLHLNVLSFVDLIPGRQKCKFNFSVGLFIRISPVMFHKRYLFS